MLPLSALSLYRFFPVCSDIGYGVFIVASFLYALFLFFKRQQRDIYVKVGLGVNALYLLGILFMVIIPRLF